MGELTITEKQAEQLNLKKSTQLAPLFEKCCLRQVANLSDSKASQEMEVQRGVKIGHTTLHRLVENQQLVEPRAESPIKETSVDGGKVRIRGAKGEGCHWQDYKAVRLHDSFYAGYFQENEVLIDYVNRQPLNSLLTCLGDGQDGIWNLIAKFNPDGNRREILDWFHLLENLHKVGGSNKRLAQAKNLLWQGRVDETIKLFELCRRRQAENFCNYLKKHRHRIVNYQLLSTQKICSPRFGSCGIIGETD